MYVADMGHIQNRYVEFWNRENHDRPLLSLHAPKDGAKRGNFTLSPDIKSNWWDAELIIRRARANMDATCYTAEALPIANPNLGPDVMAGFLGAEILFETMATSWSVNFVEDWANHYFKFDEDNIYWKKIAEITEGLLDDSKGDYLVGVTDLHSSIDCLVSMRGAENVCLDYYDCRDKVFAALAQVEAAFKEALYRSYTIIGKKQKGMVNWMGLYHDVNWYVSSMDFIYMISPQMFDDFAGPCISRDAKIIGNNIFHLDGPGSLNHLDKLLAMPEIHGIQWVYGDGQPTAAHWLDVYRRVQAADKLLTVHCTPDDMPAILAAGLRPEGTLYSVSCTSEAHCNKILADVNDAYRKKIY